MGSHSNSINCWKCGCDYAVIVYETRPFIGPNNEEGIADEWGYCNRCGYSYGQHTMGQIGEDYETMKPLSDLNYERTEWKEDREYTHLVGGQSFIPMTENLDPYTEKEYKNIIKKYNNSHLIDRYTFAAEGDSHEHGHEHEHDGEMDPDDLIYSLDKLTEFAISYIDEGGFGGESLGREVDKKRDLIIETIRYVEGSIELNIIYDMKENPLSLRFAWTDDDFSPIIYLPPPVFLARTPDEIMEHDH